MTTKKKQRRGPARGSMHIDRRVEQVLADPAADGRASDLLSTEEVAKWLGVSTAWLEIRRLGNDGPPFHTVSPRIVRYRRGDVAKWLAERKHRSTAEYRR